MLLKSRLLESPLLLLQRRMSPLLKSLLKLRWRDLEMQPRVDRLLKSMLRLLESPLLLLLRRMSLLLKSLLKLLWRNLEMMQPRVDRLLKSMLLELLL